MQRVCAILNAHSKGCLSAEPSAKNIGLNHFRHQQSDLAVVKVKCQYLTNPVCLTGTLGGKHVCSSPVWLYLLRMDCRETETVTGCVVLQRHTLLL